MRVFMKSLTSRKKAYSPWSCGGAARSPAWCKVPYHMSYQRIDLDLLAWNQRNGYMEALRLFSVQVFSHVNMIVTSRVRTLFLVFLTQNEMAMPFNGCVIDAVRLLSDGGLSSWKEVCCCFLKEVCVKTLWEHFGVTQEWHMLQNVALLVI